MATLILKYPAGLRAEIFEALKPISKETISMANFKNEFCNIEKFICVLDNYVDLIQKIRDNEFIKILEICE